MGLFGGGSGADWLIAGLGNPEPKYDGTPPTTPVLAALDALAEAWGVRDQQKQMAGPLRHCQVDGAK